MEDLGRKDPGKGYVGLQVHLKEDLRDPSTIESDALGDNQPPVEKEEKIPRKGGGGNEEQFTATSCQPNEVR
jgi:hypothetical protein